MKFMRGIYLIILFCIFISTKVFSAGDGSCYPRQESSLRANHLSLGEEVNLFSSKANQGKSFSRGFDPNNDETTPTPGGEIIVPVNGGFVFLLFLSVVYVGYVIMRKRNNHLIHKVE